MKKSRFSLVSIGLLASLVLFPVMAPAQMPPSASDPYTSHLGPRASGGDFWPDGPQPHFQEPPGYDSNLMMHPYTSGLGPCPQGQGKTVCMDAIPSSR